MKNTIKISIMSGLVTAGVLLCGLPHAMAESVPQNNETYYSVNVPSEISLNSGQDETTFTVSGNTYQKRWLDINITSKNNFNLKNGQASIPYKLDKTKLEYEPQYVDKDSDSFSESIKVSKNDNDVKFSGNYQDQLQFTMNPVETRTIQLDCNGGTVNGKDKVAYTVKNGSSYGQLPVPVRSGYQFVAWKDDKGNTIYSGSIIENGTEKLTCMWSKIIELYARSYINGQFNDYFKNCGTAILYVNGEKFTDNPNFLYCGSLKTGDTFKLDNISAQDGYVYTGMASGIKSDFTYEYYDNGLVKSVSGVVKESTISLYFNFESDNMLQSLIRKYNITKIAVDNSLPSSEDTVSLGSTNLFASKDKYYVEDTTLHIYNPNGGKVIAPVDSTGLFSNLTIKELDLKGLDVSQVENGASFFRDDYYLKSLDISTFNTSKMKSMKSMFDSCNSLKTLDVSHFDTSNVTIMDNLFRNCFQATSINVSGWNTSKTTKMEAMFAGCKSVCDLNLSSFDTSRVYSLYNMFDACESLTILDLSNFDTSNVRDIRWMFAYTNLKEIKGLENWNIPKVINLSCTFYRSTIPEIHLPRIQNIYDMDNAFSHNPNLKTIDLSNLTFDSGVDWVDSFRNCSNLESIFVSNDFRNEATVRSNTFLGCNLLVGGSGTKYDPTFIDSTGARIDGGPNNPGYFTAISQKPIETGSVLNIEGSDYIVMGQTEDGNYRLISGTSIGNIQYQPNQDSSGNYKLNVSDEPDKKRYDGHNSNTYENSYIDRYLENTWYKNLPASMQKAIQETKIKQVSYTDSTTNPKWKFFDPEGGTNKYWYYNEGNEIEPNWVIYNKAKIPDNESGTYPYRYWSQKDAFDNEIYNSISRHVFLPCVEDIYNIVDLNNANKIRDFLNSTDNHLNYIWLRDAYSNSSQTALYLDYNTRSMDNYYVTSKAMGIRPAFVIDLSKIDYTVTGTVNYK